MRDLINKIRLLESTGIDKFKIFSNLIADRDGIHFSINIPNLNFRNWDEEDYRLGRAVLKKIYLLSNDFKKNAATGQLEPKGNELPNFYISTRFSDNNLSQDEKEEALKYTEVQEICRKAISDAGIGDVIAKKLEFHNEFIKAPPEFVAAIDTAYWFGVEELGLEVPNPFEDAE